MKRIILLLSLGAGLMLTACSDSDTKSATQQAPETMTNTTTANNTPAATGSVGAAANGEKHYICPNNCEGSGGDASGNCPVCGSAYVHNAAFHANQATTPTTADNSGSPVINMNQPAPEPAQNAKGVWHYTCPNGCAGGGGSATACATCGATMVHNVTYHQ